ncbi:ER oxidoreductin KNAG_0G03630 [Huiozyma naganishii CBS 8797]|uniref:Endoplasmic oxidoreductin n=1 Tax=Huiozyma naganishii (strain ATCC MYA-139 / BCRC 22969 / CBS 8797 / KCTC 17520 / NBRC 10181 / NCYC 3082 / Yp74L-3) TaxID=1071383 RepID=J7R976_HUIN7|nr:hypothetical protein KNAG_0G03630 [Kazachstania naganishii CBS 8797]CCK71420.1 hypothetical protein KNAG_0G03630 [Kazachstania naganishii CBS 8797]
MRWSDLFVLGALTVPSLAQPNEQTAFSTKNDMTPFCKIDKDEKLGPNCDASITAINNINRKIRSDLVGLVQTDFFKYFKFDPLKKCAIWENNDGLCFSRSCAIDVVEDWDSLPAYWQPEVLGGLSNDTNSDTESLGHDNDVSFLNQLCEKHEPLLPADFDEEDINYYDVTDFTSDTAVLVDLTANPERFTGYGGQQAGQIWQSIYAENCFPADDGQEQCLAKDGFYRMMSGLHASIGTHLSNDHLNTETGKWGPDLDLFMARVGNFPDRVSNIYFNYAVVAKALWKVKPYLKHLDFCTDYDNDVKSKILNIVSQLDSKIFDENLMFENQVDSVLKDEFRKRFKNVTRIMDCVHCDRCKMWGKVQTTGYATSLKILFELDESDELSMQRVVDKLTKFELIALINTFGRLSNSIEAINNFEKLYNKRMDNNSGVASFLQNNFFKLLSKATDSIRDKINGSINGSGTLGKKDEEKQKAPKQPASPKFVDLKMPQRKIEEKDKGTTGVSSNRWKRAWETEWHNYKEAVRFVWRSYVDLPRNLWNLILVNANRLWNSFIGVTGYLSEEEEDPSVYKLDFQ